VIRLIAAVDQAFGIANDTGIPWQGKLPTDAQYFRDQTTSGIILMGYATYEEFLRPLHDRENFVVERPGSGPLRPGFVGVNDLSGFLDAHGDELIWVIGGAALFAATIERADQLYLTQLGREFGCTKFFPTLTDAFVLASESEPRVENDIPFRFTLWNRRSSAHA